VHKSIAGITTDDLIEQMLMVHAKVWHCYHEKLNATGKITMKISNKFAFPRRFSNPDDLAAAHRSNYFSLEILLSPTVRGMVYPESLKNTTGASLTQLKTKDLSYLHGTVDFLAIDAYSQMSATPPDDGIEACAANVSHSLWPICVNTTAYDANG
jgi:beta-glucosidase/6-phospho-beta-glucosidase/beta-galactosidase